jgi:hypothetical protein
MRLEANQKRLAKSFQSRNPSKYSMLWQSPAEPTLDRYLHKILKDYQANDLKKNGISE